MDDACRGGLLASCECAARDSIYGVIQLSHRFKRDADGMPLSRWQGRNGATGSRGMPFPVEHRSGTSQSLVAGWAAKISVIQLRVPCGNSIIEL